MTDDFLLIVVGAISPSIIDFINRYVKSSKARFLIALVFSVVVGSVWSILKSGWQTVWEDVSVVFITSQTVYKIFYENSNLQDKIRSV